MFSASRIDLFLDLLKEDMKKERAKKSFFFQQSFVVALLVFELKGDSVFSGNFICTRYLV